MGFPEPIGEQFLFVLTSSPVDLRGLADLVNYDLAIARDTPQLPPKRPKIRYDVLHVPFTLHPLQTEERQAEIAATTPRLCHGQVKERPLTA